MTAEIMNWTGYLVAAPRSDLAHLLNRPEVRRTGLYVLLGDDLQGSGRPLAYIGEADDVGNRLRQHARSQDQGGKDFWDRAIVLTSKDMNLTKAHARYLESRLIEVARMAGRARLDNSTAPPLPKLPEADVSDMEYFIEQARIVMPVLGVNIFRTPEAAVAVPSGEGTDARRDSPIFTMSVKSEGIEARAREIDGEFTVLQGSGARSAWKGAESHAYRSLRVRLEQDGTIAPSVDGTNMVFTRDHVFASPSAAAAMIAGRAANGRKEWVDRSSGISYGEWETQGVD
ncbi:GIY-YIG nuclease family protein [Gordonia paraffinivorans]|uniref:GIY-YIG nuclease family protein n=1 Tax=Gordonia paraffinivorans TaxID=175628 RepID=UPI001FF9E50C|nr:GIY-YIG nuclease family protein [Gordonia paraffinivorans]